VIFTMLIFLGVVMIACLLGVFVIPRFDRPLAVSPVGPVVAGGPVAGLASRSAR
jgi:hypothetical protein